MAIALLLFIVLIGPLAVYFGADSRNTRSDLTLR
jgi:hypothetical protein